MAPLGLHIESLLGILLSPLRAHDSKIFTSSQSPTASCSALPTPTITIHSPEVGPSGSKLSFRHTLFAKSQFPELEWTLPAELAGEDEKGEKKVKEYLLIMEDPDAPMPTPVVHGLFYGIDGSRTRLADSDFEKVDEGVAGSGKSTHVLRGGFHYGQNRRGEIYTGARAIMSHGIHRYHFQIVALGKRVDWEKVEDGKVLTRKEVEEAVRGKLVGWGVWIGNWERVWGAEEG